MAQSVFQTLLGLPAFLFAVWVMYWSLPLGSLFLYLKVWKIAGRRNDVYQWWVLLLGDLAHGSHDTDLAACLACRCNFLVHAFCIRVRKYGKNEVYRDGPCMFLVSSSSQRLGMPLQQAVGGSHLCLVCPNCGCDSLQSNHRSWADFFIDAYLTEGRGQLMSRWAGRLRRKGIRLLSSSGRSRDALQPSAAWARLCC